MIKEEVRDSSKLASVYCSEELLEKVGGNVFQLVRIAAKRALELDAGKPILITNPSSDKATTIALEEISQGKVTYKEKNIKAKDVV